MLLLLIVHNITKQQQASAESNKNFQRGHVVQVLERFLHGYKFADDTTVLGECVEVLAEESQYVI